MPDIVEGHPNVVHLKINALGDWCSITCGVCGQIVVNGDLRILKATLLELVQRVAVLHIHAGYS